MIAAKLDAAVRDVCPIDGISIGRENDKMTWRIDFRDEATTEQRQAAQAVLDAFDVEAERARLAALAQIGALEREQMLPRVTREVHLAAVVKDYMREQGVDAATALAQLTDEQHPGFNYGFVKLKAFDDAIRALREQL